MSELVAITHLAARGDGVGKRADGRPVYLPMAAPGDVARLDAAGAVLAIAPGPHHAVPACRHYGACGGCSLQHVDADTYAGWLKSRILVELDKQNVVPMQVMPPHVSPARSRRRASLRAVTDKGGAVQLGFNTIRSHDIVDVQDCPVLHPELFALVAQLRAWLTGRIAPGRAVGAQMTLTDRGIDLLLVNMAPGGSDDRAAMARFAGEARLARLTLEHADGRDLVMQARAPVLMMGGVAVVLPAGGFVQATAEGQTALADAVLAATGDASRVADLFAGIGTFSFPLAAAAQVTAIEGDAAALAALSEAASRSGRPVKALRRDLFRQPLQPDELAPFDVVVTDPPRAGCEAQMRAVARSELSRVVSVSCNPVSFARDAAILARAGFALARLWPVGQFLWSTHVEMVAELVR